MRIIRRREVGGLSVIIRAKYERDVLIPLSKINELRDGEVVIIKILGKDIAEEVFGSIKVEKEKIDKALREV